MPSILDFWGKANPKQTRSSTWHPLVFHSLDVAAVCHVLMNAPEFHYRTFFSRLLDIDDSQCSDLLVHLLAIHDIGKFAQKFQAKVPDRFPDDIFDRSPSQLPTSYDHASGGFSFFHLNDKFLPGGLGWRSAKYLIAAATGHHGLPPSLDVKATIVRDNFGQPGIDYATHFLQCVSTLFGMTTPSGLKDKQCRKASFCLAGFAVLCDWIGSNEEWFPYQDPHDFPDLYTYWKYACDNAQKAVHESGIEPTPLSKRLTLKDLVGENVQSTPLQAWAENAPLANDPTLYVIEDETGSGKTEAALMLAYRLMREGLGHGIYVALPTMATSNAMFDRVSKHCHAMFKYGEEPSVALIHGSSALHPGFKDILIPESDNTSSYSSKQSSESDDSDITATTSYSQWMRDDRRRAFLADIGVGTIDQALLSVLHSKYQSLRLFGLSQKILILDEVHAYDAYMKVEIEQLLQFHAAQGGCAIMLSATLPPKIKNKFATKYVEGANNRASDRDNEGAVLDYPLVTTVSGYGSHIHEIGPSKSKRIIPVRFLRSMDSGVDYAVNAAKQGLATVYIQNTVTDVLESAQKAIQRGIEPVVFHSRFTLSDRLRIERQVLQRWGKDSKQDDRGGLLIATQVVEQSLDLDFDAMVTDLAPIDLVIQRAGRLWRHLHRKDRVGDPVLVVVSAEPSDNCSESWYRELFPRGAFVYKNHELLWRTAKVLHEQGCIDSPDGLRNLVNSVYESDSNFESPSALKGIGKTVEGQEGIHRDLATHYVLKLSEGYVREGGRWDSDERVHTRIDDVPSVSCVLCYEKDNELQPLATKTDQSTPDYDWRMSEIKVSAHQTGKLSVPKEYEQRINMLRSRFRWDTSRLDRDKHIVIVHQIDENEWRGLSLASNDNVLSYNNKLGLRFIQD